MSTLVVETIKHTNDTTLFASDTSGQLTVKGEGTNTTNLQQGLTKVWCSWTGVSAVAYDSFNVSSLTDNSATENLVSYTNGFNTAGHMAINYSSNHNSGGLDQNSSSYLGVYSPNPGSAKFLSMSNQNAAYQTCNISGDLT